MSTLPSPAEKRASQQILLAENVTDVVRLAPLSRGVAQMVWIQRMNEFGASAISPIVRRLKSSQSIADDPQRRLVVERLVGALKRLGQAGGEALLSCFNNLDAYDQSLATVALGVIGYEPACEAIERYYQRVKKDADSSKVVGALWGLIDLHSAQSDQAIAEQLDFLPERSLAELYPFAALAGGEACVRPLAFRLQRADDGGARYEGEGRDIAMALVAIGHRLGEQKYTTLLHQCEPGLETAHEIASATFTRTPEDVAKHFAMYFTHPDAPLSDGPPSDGPAPTDTAP